MPTAVPDVWETSIHSLPPRLRGPNDPPVVDTGFSEEDLDTDHLMVVWAEPKDKLRPSAGITVRGSILTAKDFPSAIAEFGAHTNFGDNEVSLSDGMLRVEEDWFQRGVAAIALARLVRWAKHYHPDRNVHRYNIGTYPNEKRKYLRRLYASFNITWNLTAEPGPGQSWHSDPVRVHQLQIPAMPESQPTAIELMRFLKSRDDGHAKTRLELAAATSCIGQLQSPLLKVPKGPISSFIRRLKGTPSS